jgi:hypothetical protein
MAFELGVCILIFCDQIQKYDNRFNYVLENHGGNVVLLVYIGIVIFK